MYLKKSSILSAKANNKIIRGIIYALISSITFGLLPFFSIPVKAQGMSSETLMFYRFLFSIIIYGLYLFFNKANFRISKKNIKDIILIGGAGYGLTGLTLVSSYDYIPSGIGTTIGFQFPVMISIFMWLFYKERLQRSIYISLALSLLGVFLLSYSPEHGMVSGYGIFLLTITNLMYSMYIIGVNKSSMKEIDSSVLTFYVITISMILCLGLSLIRGTLIPIPSLEAAGSILFMSLLSTIIANLTLILAIKSIGSTITALLSPLEPVTAIIIGIIVFNENINIQIFTGVIIIILAVILIVLNQKKKA
ncbi:MAG: DMT family transporter [Bacteroidales bacterium]|nr:DMT family transporter [Bacteroidales bacterium]